MLDPTELFPEIPNLYEFLSVHADMIYDERRVEAYREAIDRTVKPGDVVADVGTGTGILAFLCVQRGASRVHAIDRSPVIQWARQLADKNGFSDRIVFHNQDSRTLSLNEKVDIIVSELIGHIAFEEGMVETISDARERLLKPGGSLIPQSVILHAAPVSESEVFTACVDGWKPAYGIDYTIMRQLASKACYIADIQGSKLLGRAKPVFAVDFTAGTEIATHCSRTFTIHRADVMTGIAFWFDAVLTEQVRLSSGPWSKTHWKQCFKPIPDPILVQIGDRINVDFEMKFRNRKQDEFMFSVDVRKGESCAS
jgi:protein arginine N-methyltransferase 1